MDKKERTPVEIVLQTLTGTEGNYKVASESVLPIFSSVPALEVR
jgi:hypothetical protein